VSNQFALSANHRSNTAITCAPYQDQNGLGRGGMGVAITLCDETKYERRKDKHDNSLFGRSEAKSLPNLIEFETHSVFQPQINTNGDEFINPEILTRKPV
jgi:hypothetical protein